MTANGGERHHNDQQHLADAKEEQRQSNDPQSVQPNLQSQPNSTTIGTSAFIDSHTLAGFSAAQAQFQTQQQMMLMQMLQMGQQQPLMANGQGGMNSSPQGLAHLINLQHQQQQRLNLLQAMGNPMTVNYAGANPHQQQMNQLFLANMNMGNVFPINRLSNNNNAIASSDPTTPIGPDTNSSALSLPRDNQVVTDLGWEDQYAALKQYKLIHGHVKVPARYKENPKLGRWVMTQRRQMALMHQGYPNALTVERVVKLDEVGFVWSVRAEPLSVWNKKMEELKEYKKKFGNTMVPQRYQDNPPLGTWVHTQRRQYKLLTEGKKSSMTQDKIDSLNEVGFIWVARNNDVMEESNDDKEDEKNDDDDEKVGLATQKEESVDTEKKAAGKVVNQL